MHLPGKQEWQYNLRMLQKVQDVVLQCIETLHLLHKEH